MRKGWKTRIEERKYFEERKQDREDKAAMRQFVMQRMNADIEQRLAEMRANHEIN